MQRDPIKYHKSFGPSPVVLPILTERKSIKDSIPSRNEFYKLFTAISSALLLSIWITSFALTWRSDTASVIWLKAGQILSTTSGSQLLELARICERRNRPACSQDAFETMLLESKDKRSVYPIYANFLIRNGQSIYAQKMLESYLDAGGNDSDYIYQLAVLQRRNGEFSSAILNLKNSIRLSPSYKKPMFAYRDLIQLQVQLQQMDDAKHTLQVAVRETPEIKKQLIPEIQVLRQTRTLRAPASVVRTESRFWPRVEKKIRKVVIRL